jgi:hypothetical protein
MITPELQLLLERHAELQQLLATVYYHTSPVDAQPISLEACQRELKVMRHDAATYQREMELLKGQFKDKNKIITLLRGGYNRSN